MADVQGRDDHLVARLADRGRASRKEDIGVESIEGGGRQAPSTGVGPEHGGLAPLRRGDGSVVSSEQNALVT
jgi:hypothetical protein